MREAKLLEHEKVLEAKMMGKEMPKKNGKRMSGLLLPTSVLVLLIVAILVSFQLFSTSAKPTYQANICSDTVISMGSVKIKVTDQNDQPLEPMREVDIDTGKVYNSGSYKVRVKNVGTLPLKFLITPQNVGGDEDLISNITLRGYIDDPDNAEDTTTNRGVLNTEPRLIRCDYLNPGEYRDISIRATIRKNIDLEYKNCTYDLYVQAMQAEPR